MDWWHKLKNNPLARLGAVILLIFYFMAIAAEFVAPYDPYSTQAEGSLLPPTQIYWRSPDGAWIGPHVYPATQGPVSLETGTRELKIDTNQPSSIRLFVKGPEYRFLRLVLPVPTHFYFSSTQDPQAEEDATPLPGEENNGSKRFSPSLFDIRLNFEDTVITPGFKGNRHLFGTLGTGYLNVLGTDEQARDQLSRLIYGSRISLSIGLVGIALSFPLGMLIGGISGYFGGITDAILMRVVEVLMTIPTIYLLIALAGVLPAEWSSAQRFLCIILITSFVSWAGLARVIRGQVLSIKKRSFVQASQSMGGRSLYTIIRHVLPQTATYVVISSTLAVPGFIVAEAVLSLIGLGIQQPDPSWGNMLSLATNASVLVLQPWLVWSPAILIVLTVLSFNLLGDGLRDALDPKSLER
ncbi:MAG: ABC transporter permease [Cyanobacteria bacterium P01_F01_bin.150]